MQTPSRVQRVRSRKLSSNYISYSPITDVRSFVVNLHDALNFDLDLGLNEEERQRYSSVIRNDYTYYSLKTPGTTELGELMHGKTYRCRLRNITPRHRTGHISGSVLTDIRRFIDRANGWVKLVVGDVDVYQRILVDIYILLPGKALDLRSYLLMRYPQLFMEYNR